MDLNKLKVADLRAELQARNLETKGVKAVLIDRLKAALDAEAKENEGEGGAPAVIKAIPEPSTPSTPSRPRRRSTRSRTKSPSPTRVLQEPPTLPPVTEEPHSEDAEMKESEETVTPEPTQTQEKETLKTPEKPKEEPKPSEPERTSPQVEPVKAEEPPVSQPVEPVEMEPAKPEEVEVKPTESPQKVQETEKPPATEEKPESMEVDSSAEKADTSLNKSIEKEKSDVDTDSKTKDQTTDDERKRKRSTSPSPKKRQKLPPPNTDDFVAEEEEPELDNSKIQLSWFDSDLNLKINRENFTSASSMSESGLALVWAGARTNYGVKANGKYFYEVQISGSNDKIHYPNEKRLHEFRCGWSVANTTNLQLGEFENSYGFDSSGKKCLNNVFSDYVNRFGLDDVIGVHLDLNDEKCKILFTLNGKDCGTAFEFNKSDLKDEALYPHILTKNYEIKLNFGQLEESLWSKRRDEYKEKELSRRKNDQERKKKDFERKKEQLERRKADAEKKKQQEAEKKKEESESKPAEESAEKSEEAPKENGENKKDESAAATTEEPQPEKPAETKEKESAEETKEKPVEELVEPVWEEIKMEDLDAEIPHDNKLDGFLHIGSVNIDELVLGPQRPVSRKECEVFMLIGLPGAGKTHWALEKCATLPEKRYTVLGTKFLLDKMRIFGEARKRSYSLRWEKLIEMCNRGIQTLCDIAAVRRRNYILDQPHVYTSVQRRKMRVFGDFKRVAVIVVPDEEEYKRRLKERIDKEGKDLPDHTINELRANISLPELEYKWFDEILYTDLDGEKAKEVVRKENERGKKELNRRQRNDYGRGRDYGRNNRDQRWNRDSRDRWVPPPGPMPQLPPPAFRRDFYDNRDRRGGGWGQDNWMQNNRSRGYGGAPPPRPGRRNDRDRDRRDRRDRDRRDYRSSGNSNSGSNKNRSGGSSSNRNDRRDDRGNSKGNAASKDWNSGANAAAAGQWGNNWNSYSPWGQQVNYAQDPNLNNATQDPQQWYQAYYQQQQQWPTGGQTQQNQNWYGAQSYDNTKQ